MSTILKLLMPLYLTTAVVYTTDNQIGEEEVLAGGGINNYKPISNTDNTPNSSNGSSTGGSDTNSPPATKPTTAVVSDIITDTELQGQLAAALAKAKSDRAKAKSDRAKDKKNTTNSIVQKLTTRVEDLLMSNPNYGLINLQVKPKDLLKLLNALDQYAYYTSRNKVTAPTSNASNGIGTYGLGTDESAEEMLLLNATVDSKLSLDGQIVGPFNWPRNGDQPPRAQDFDVGFGQFDYVLLNNSCKSWQDILNATEISTGALIALIEMDEDNTTHQRLKYFFTLSQEQQEKTLMILINYKGELIYNFKEYYKGAYDPSAPHYFDPIYNIASGTTYESRVEFLALDNIQEIRERIAAAGYKPSAESSPTDTRIYTGIGDLVESGVNFRDIQSLDRDNKDQRRLTFFFALNGAQQTSVFLYLARANSTSSMRQAIEDAGGPPVYPKFQSIQEIQDNLEINPETIAALKLIDRDNKNQRRLTFFFTLNGAQQAKMLLALTGANSTSSMRQAIEDAGGPPVYPKFQSIQEIQDNLEINPETIAALKLIDRDNKDHSRWNFFLTLNGNKQAAILSQPSIESLRQSIEAAGGPPAYRQFNTLQDIQDDSEINPKTIDAMKKLDTTHYNNFFTLTARQQFLVLQQTDEYGMRYAMDLLGTATLDQLEKATSTDVYNAFLTLDNDNDSKLRLNFFLSLPPGARSIQDIILSAFPDIKAVKNYIEQFSQGLVPAHFPLKETEITADTLSQISEISDSSKALTLFATLDDKYSDKNQARRDSFFKETYKDQITVLNSTDPLSLYNYIYDLPPNWPMPDAETPFGRMTNIGMVSRVNTATTPYSLFIQKLSVDEQNFFFNNLPVALQSYTLRLTESSSGSEETKIAIIQEQIKQFGGPAAS